MFTITFDFVAHELIIQTDRGRQETIPLEPRTVAAFYQLLMDTLRRMNLETRIWPMPVEIPDPIRFDQDTVHHSYDPHAASSFWRILVTIKPIFEAFRCEFIGKSSPVHFFWGSFDLAVTRFSGRTASPPQGVTPNVASWVMAEAYSHEVSSCGFWPGNGGYGRAAFYAYAYPEPAGYGDALLGTPAAFYEKSLGQFILPYDAVREARDPDALLLGFLQETYDAAADLAQWDRAMLERGK
jgi:hypothetical protein